MSAVKVALLAADSRTIRLRRSILWVREKSIPKESHFGAVTSSPIRLIAIEYYCTRLVNLQA